MRRTVKAFLAGELNHYQESMSEAKELQAEYELALKQGCCARATELYNRLAMLNHLDDAVTKLKLSCSSDQDLSRVLETAYLNRPDQSDGDIARSLFLSRAHYYRLKDKILKAMARMYGLT